MVITKGMGATVRIGSDCYPYTIIEVSPDYKTVKIQRDNYKPAKDYDYYKNQVYDYIPNTEAPIEVWTIRNNGRYVKKGESKNSPFLLTIGNKIAYSDPSF